MQTFDIDMDEVLARFSADSSEKDGAQRLISAIDAVRGDAPRPVPVWVAALLTRITSASAIMVSHPDLIYIPRRDLENQIPYTWLIGRPDTQIVLFDDGSFLIFEVSGHLCGIPLRVTGEGKLPLDFDTAFQARPHFERLSATSDILARHPDGAAWIDILPPYPPIRVSGHGQEEILHRVYAAIEDLYDPPIAPGSLKGEYDYSQEEATTLSSLAEMFWKALGVPHAARVEIRSRMPEDESHTPTVIVVREADHVYLESAAQALEASLAECIDMTCFTGFEWVCDRDEDEARASAYRQQPARIVHYVDPENKQVSQHALLEVRARALRTLSERGIEPKRAHALICPSLETISGPPIREPDDDIPF